jgi:hypothetical protein
MILLDTIESLVFIYLVQQLVLLVRLVLLGHLEFL